MTRTSVTRALFLILLFLSLTACGGGDGGGNPPPNPNPQNGAPTVAIQVSPKDLDQNGITEGATVTLKAVASDPDGDAITFAWEQLSGSPVTLSDVAEVSFTAPAAGPGGERYAFRVTVEDSGGASASAIVEFDVHFVNVQPEAVLQVEQAEAVEQTVVRFDATGSNDPDGQPLSFHWEQVENGTPAAGIVDNGDGTADVTLPDIGPVLNGAPLRIRVTVDDESGAPNASASMEAELSVLFVNTEPRLVSIGPDRDGVDEGVLAPEVTLVVDAFDPDGDALSYTWEVPDNFIADGLNSNALTLLETPNVGVGGETFTFRVHVSDSLAAPVFTTAFRVNFVNQAPEIIAAGSNGPVVAGENVVLTVAAGDADGQALNFEWHQNPGDEHRADPILNPDGSASFTAPGVIGQTDLHFMVTVDDGELEDSENVTVRVNPVNAPPVVESVEQSATEVDEADGAEVTFTVTATDDNTAAENLVYAWDVPDDFSELVEGESSNQLRINGTPNVTADTPYAFNVTVRDEANAEARADFDLLVRFVNQNPSVRIEAIEPADLLDVDPEEGSQVSLRAVGEDEDGQVIEYEWSAPALGIDSQAGGEFTVILPEVSGDQPVTVQLVASDGAGGSAVDSIEFMILNRPAEPSVSIVVMPEDVVTSGVYSGHPLSLVALTENLSGAITYLWTETGGVSLGIGGSTSQSIDLPAAPDVDADGEIVTVGVTASNGEEAPLTAELEIAVHQRPAGTPLPFVFTDIDPVPVGRTAEIGGLLIDSDPIVIDGLGDGVSASVRVDNGWYSINRGEFTDVDDQVVVNGDEVRVRVVGPAGAPGMSAATLTVGDYSDAFEVIGASAQFEQSGVAGGVRWNWRALRGATGYKVYRRIGAAVGQLLTDPLLSGDAVQFDHIHPLLRSHWEDTPHVYDLRAVDAAGIERDLHGSGQPLQRNTSIDAVTYVKADSPTEGGAFGSAIAVSNDGRTLIVGAPQEGANPEERQGEVYVYRRDGDQWDPVQVLTGPNEDDRFGAAIALSGDGQVLAIGAPGADIPVGDGSDVDGGYVYIYRYDAENRRFNEEMRLAPASVSNAGDEFGSSLALDNEGRLLAVGVPLDDQPDTALPGVDDLPDSGAVYVFADSAGAGAWQPTAYLKEAVPAENNRFGSAVALSDLSGASFGERLFVSRLAASRRVYVFDNNATETWTPPANANLAMVEFDAPAYGENIVATRTGFAGLRFVSGAIYHFAQSGRWATGNFITQFPSRPPSTDGSVASTISPDGAWVAFGLGTSDLPGDAGIYNVVPEAPADNAGGIYVYQLPSATSALFRAYVKAPNPDDDDHFGECLAFDTSVAGGAPRLFACASAEDSAGAGVHPVDPDMREDNNAQDSGAVYVY